MEGASYSTVDIATTRPRFDGFTDYDGTGEKPISFKLHGTLDAVKAITAAMAPVLLGFAAEPQSAFFFGQAANEVVVISATDWDAGMRTGSRRRQAA